MIDAVAIDTDVLSYIFKGDTRADLYLPHLDGKLGVVSFMTVAELRHWTMVRNWGEMRRRSLEEFIGQYVIVHSDDSLCSVWARIATEAVRFGRPIETADAWIAAVAVVHNIPLITHNRSHFEGVDGLKVISES